MVIRASRAVYFCLLIHAGPTKGGASKRPTTAAASRPRRGRRDTGSVACDPCSLAEAIHCRSAQTFGSAEGPSRAIRNRTRFASPDSRASISTAHARSSAFGATMAVGLCCWMAVEAVSLALAPSWMAPTTRNRPENRVPCRARVLAPRVSATGEQEFVSLDRAIIEFWRRVRSEQNPEK